MCEPFVICDSGILQAGCHFCCPLYCHWSIEGTWFIDLWCTAYG